MGLSSTQMIDVANTFQDAYAHVLNNLEGLSVKPTVISFTAGVVLTEKPYMLVTEEGIQRAIGLVFSREDIRDFVLTLTYTFFARWDAGPSSVRDLAENLAQGVGGVVGGNIDLSAMPIEIQQRLMLRGDASELLQSNPWLMTLLLMQLFINVTTESKPTPGAT